MGFRLVFLAVGTIIALQFSESVFLRGINGAGELLYEIDHQPVCKFTYKQTDELLHRSRVERLLIPVFLFETVFHKAQRVFLCIRVLRRDESSVFFCTIWGGFKLCNTKTGSI